jgi:hypothetical protein
LRLARRGVLYALEALSMDDDDELVLVHRTAEYVEGKAHEDGAKCWCVPHRFTFGEVARLGLDATSVEVVRLERLH